MKIYNFRDHVKGDTFSAVSSATLIDEVLADLTGASIRIDFRLSVSSPSALSLTNTSGITIAADGSSFSINKQKIDIPAGLYMYDVEVTYASGDKYTYTRGTLRVLQDISHS